MALKKVLKKLQDSYRKTVLHCIDEVNLLGFTTDYKITDVVPSEVRKRIDEKIREWRESGILTGYLKYLTDNMRYTYIYVIKVVILACYYQQITELQEICNEVFKVVAEDSTKKVSEDTGHTYFIDDILQFLIVPIVSIPFHDYLYILAQTSAEELENSVVSALQHEISLRKLVDKFKKQTNRLLSINDERFSGALNETSRSLFNQVYVYHLQGEKVRFVAEMDNRTTEMCRSLDGQIFNVSSLNKFYRYSDLAGGMVHYEIVGLQQGVNLPPINDHFHWCRSTIVYTR